MWDMWESMAFCMDESMVRSAFSVVSSMIVVWEQADSSSVSSSILMVCPFGMRKVK